MTDHIAWFRERGLNCTERPDIREFLDYEAPIRLWPGAFLRASMVGAYSYVSHNSALLCATLGRYCSVGADCRLGLSAHPLDRLTSSVITYRTAFDGGEQWDSGVEEAKPLTIGPDVWVGTRALIMGGLTIGAGAVIGAGAIVTRDVPPYAIAVGNPARVKRLRFSESLVERLLASEWWKWDLPPVAASGAIDWSDPARSLDNIEALAAQGVLKQIANRAARIEIDEAGNYLFRRPM